MDANNKQQTTEDIKIETNKKLVVYIESELKELVPDFLKNMEAEINGIEEIWSNLNKNWDTENASTLAKKSHKLAGSSGSFGFMDVSKSARAIEVLIKSIIEKNSSINLEQKNEIASLLQIIKVTSNATIVFEGETTTSTDKTNVSKLLPEDNRLIYIVEDDISVAKYLELQIGYFGYNVHIFEKVSDFMSALKENIPAAIIMDISFPEDELAGTKAMQEVQKWHKQIISAIFISTRDDLKTRLQTVRANGCAYFTKPINVSELIDKLDVITSHKIPEPYKVLIIDDDVSTAGSFATILQHAGFITTVINNPLAVMKPLDEFKPDIILMDVYMPECNGMELASIIRQQETYVSIPIVFLSVEKDIKKQLSAMSLGGDDFLTKPIAADHLISTISARIERARILRSYMKLDSLTGLLNHTATLEHLEIEISRAKRHNGNLVFAMIDIDYFKKVNDTYGHLTGDKVLKSLSRLLKKRLRKTDIIGRYGGEEFAVILLDTDTHNALKIMDEIRESFSQVYHYSGSKEFTVSLSCGISLFPIYKDSISITESADKALYQAKNKGRNQVVLADKLIYE